MKKVIALLLAMSLLCALAACDNKQSESTPLLSGTIESSGQITTSRPAISEQETISSTTTVPTVTEPPVTEPPATEPPVTEPPATEPPATEPPATDPPATKPPVTEPPTTPTEPLPKPDPLPDYEPVPGEVKITMTFVGDCTFGRNHKAAYSNSFDECYDNYGKDYFLSNVIDLFESDDITVINLEGPLTTSNDIQEKTWNHKGRPEYVEIMTGSSVEVATFANNHRLDYGQSGSDETVRVMDKAGITYCYDNIYAVYEVKGVRVGIVAVNALQGWKVEKWLQEGQQTLREKGCAVVVACIHWGGDKATELNGYQESLGPRAIDMGYDLVVGHHPHVLQAVQCYKGKFICYSLGNFCYGGSKNPVDKDSAIFQQTFTVVDGELTEEVDAQLIPCYLSSVSNRNDYRPTLAVEEEFRRIIEKINGYSRRFDFAFDSDGRPILDEE